MFWWGSLAFAIHSHAPRVSHPQRQSGRPKRQPTKCRCSCDQSASLYWISDLGLFPQDPRGRCPHDYLRSFSLRDFPVDPSAQTRLIISSHQRALLSGLLRRKTWSLSTLCLLQPPKAEGGYNAFSSHCKNCRQGKRNGCYSRSCLYNKV